MGIYINPKGSKEEWIIENGREISYEEVINHSDYKNNILIVLLKLPLYSALLVVTDEEEKQDTVIYENSKENPRVMVYYIVPIDKILEELDESDLRDQGRDI